MWPTQFTQIPFHAQRSEDAVAIRKRRATTGGSNTRSIVSSSAMQSHHHIGPAPSMDAKQKTTRRTTNGKCPYLLRVGKAGEVRRSEKPPPAGNPGETHAMRCDVMRCDEAAQDLCGGDGGLGERVEVEERGRSWDWEPGNCRNGEVFLCFFLSFCMRGLCFAFGGEDGEETLFFLPPTHTDTRTHLFRSLNHRSP